MINSTWDCHFFVRPFISRRLHLREWKMRRAHRHIQIRWKTMENYKMKTEKGVQTSAAQSRPITPSCHDHHQHHHGLFGSKDQRRSYHNIIIVANCCCNVTFSFVPPFLLRTLHLTFNKSNVKRKATAHTCNQFPVFGIGAFIFSYWLYFSSLLDNKNISSGRKGGGVNCIFFVNNKQTSLLLVSL